MGDDYKLRGGVYQLLRRPEVKKIEISSDFDKLVDAVMVKFFLGIKKWMTSRSIRLKELRDCRLTCLGG
jgi:hypothetical protein